MKIFAYGDCNTSGISDVSVPSEFASLMERHLGPVELNNFGAAMLTSREGVAIVRERELGEGIYLISFGLVDAWFTSLPSVYIPYFPESRSRRIQRKLLKSLKKRLRSSLARRLFGYAAVVPLTEFQKNLENIVKIIQDRNKKNIILIWGAVPVLDEPRRRNLINYNGAAKRVAENNRVRYLDTPRALNFLTRAEAFLDDVHLSNKAIKLISSNLYSLAKEELIFDWNSNIE